MLRTFLILLALLIILALVLVGLGVINLDRSGDGLSVETRDVEVGTTETNVQLPVVRMEERTVDLPSVGVQEENTANTQ